MVSWISRASSPAEFGSGGVFRVLVMYVVYLIARQKPWQRWEGSPEVQVFVEATSIASSCYSFSFSTYPLQVFVADANNWLLRGSALDASNRECTM